MAILLLTSLIICTIVTGYNKQALYPINEINLKSLPEIYNVKINCNAKGDGITDDTMAIQNCSKLLSSTGGVLYFPTGIYLISAPIYFTNFVCKSVSDFVYIITLNTF